MSIIPKKSLLCRGRDWLFTRAGGKLIQETWIPAPSVIEQQITFHFRNRELNVSADSGTPLYETVAELVDLDAYQLRRITWPNSKSFTVVDIGANVGVASLLFSQFSGARVLAFEPLPANLAKLRRNIEQNNLDNIIPVAAAVSSAKGEATFHVNPVANVGGRLDGSPAGAGNAITVPTITWSDVRAMSGTNDIFLVKMDCEGGEYDILVSIPDDELRRIPYLTFEIHDLDHTRRLAWVVEKLHGLGFTLNYQSDLFHRPNLHHLLATNKTAATP